MEKPTSNQVQSHISKLGYYQVIGGALGIILLFLTALQNDSFTILVVFIYLFMCSAFVYSVLCGMLCLKKKEKALKFSLINQILQLVGFAVLGYAFQYAAGVYLTVGVDLTKSVNMDLGFGISKFNFNFNHEKEKLEFDFNLVALVLIYWIDKLMNKVKEEKDAVIISSVGDA